MTMRSFLDEFDFDAALAPQTINTAAINTGNEDLRGYLSADFLVALGTIDELTTGSPTAGEIVVNVQHSDDNGSGSPSSFSNVALADITGVSSVSSGNIHTFDEDNTDDLQFSYVGDKAWVKVTLTPSSIDTGGPIAVFLSKRGRHQSVHETQTP